MLVWPQPLIQRLTKEIRKNRLGMVWVMVSHHTNDTAKFINLGRYIALLWFFCYNIASVGMANSQQMSGIGELLWTSQFFVPCVMEQAQTQSSRPALNKPSYQGFSILHRGYSFSKMGQYCTLCSQSCSYSLWFFCCLWCDNHKQPLFMTLAHDIKYGRGLYNNSCHELL